VALVKVELEDSSNIKRVLKKDYYNKLEKITKYLTTLKRCLLKLFKRSIKIYYYKKPVIKDY